MARIEGLMREIEDFFAGKIFIILFVYLLKKYSYILGGLLGFILGIFSQSISMFVVSFIAVMAVIYFSAESYLLKIDNSFFKSKGHSKKEIFDKYYSDDIGRMLSLKMTEPKQLVNMNHLSINDVRELFQKQLEVQLDEEFRKSDWRFFVAECIYYQRK